MLTKAIPKFRVFFFLANTANAAINKTAEIMYIKRPIIQNPFDNAKIIANTSIHINYIIKKYFCTYLLLMLFNFLAYFGKKAVATATAF